MDKEPAQEEHWYYHHGATVKYPVEGCDWVSTTDSSNYDYYVANMVLISSDRSSLRDDWLIYIYLSMYPCIDVIDDTRVNLSCFKSINAFYATKVECQMSNVQYPMSNVQCQIQ